MEIPKPTEEIPTQSGSCRNRNDMSEQVFVQTLSKFDVKNFEI